MDTFAALNSILVKLFNDILNIEEKALITEEFKDISVRICTLSKQLVLQNLVPCL